MLAKALHVVGRVRPFVTPLPSHQSRIKDGLSAAHISPNWHNASWRLLMTMMHMLRMLLLRPLDT